MVVAVNALATLAILVYPPICILLHFDPQTTGVMLGGTIHDVAQVVGAGYAVSVAVGNTAVIVKLFRVFLLLPVVLGVGWYFTRKGMKHGEARVPVPVFAIVFLILCVVNSVVPLMPALMPIYAPTKSRADAKPRPGACCWRSARSGSAPRSTSIIALGWRHIATVLAHDRRHFRRGDRRAAVDRLVENPKSRIVGAERGR